jgi:hypothetical protein
MILDIILASYYLAQVVCSREELPVDRALEKLEKARFGAPAAGPVKWKSRERVKKESERMERVNARERKARKRVEQGARAGT